MDPLLIKLAIGGLAVLGCIGLFFGIGLALVIGVVVNYVKVPYGDPVLLFVGVAAVMIAIILDAFAYRRLPSDKGTTTKGIVISIAAGVLMGFFFRFVVASMATDFANPEAGMLTPYSAVFVFAVGLLLSSFLWNTIVMTKPFVGEPVSFGSYFSQGPPKLHLVGILGGIIWSIGMSLSIIASGKAGPSISYGLGQGATMVAAFWGVFIWKEFKGAPAGTNRLLGLMFVFYIIGLALIVYAGNV